MTTGRQHRKDPGPAAFAKVALQCGSPRKLRQPEVGTPGTPRRQRHSRSLVLFASVSMTNRQDRDIRQHDTAASLTSFVATSRPLLKYGRDWTHQSEARCRHHSLDSERRDVKAERTRGREEQLGGDDTCAEVRPSPRVPPDEAADDETLLANQTTCSSGSNDAPSKPDSESGTGSTELSANESQEGLHDEDGQRDAGLTRRKSALIEAVRNQRGDYVCPVCDEVTDSSHAFTLHIRQHNPTDHSHTCRLCGKTLSSASSLDRHMLVHSGERPFKCAVCHMAFTTNGNMHRHMRTHSVPEEAADTLRSPKAPLKRKPSVEVDTPPLSPKVPCTADASDAVPCEDICCPVCGKSFLCRSGLANHMSTHPNDPIQCKKCCEVTANYGAYVDHRCDGATDPKAAAEDGEAVAKPGPPTGFHDLTFVDFSTGKFSLIAKAVCESKVRRPSSAYHVFECELCKRAFPCGSALRLHAQSHGGPRGTFCPSCSCDFTSPTFLEMHQLKHRKAEQCHWDDVRCNKEDFLALFELQTNASHVAIREVTARPRAKEEHFENYAYFNGTKQREPEKEAGHDFADIQSIISVTSKAPLAATSPGQTGASPRPGSPLVADSAAASPRRDSCQHGETGRLGCNGREFEHRLAGGKSASLHMQAL
ncbi:hypothetical protein HPB47_012239 [Ixodes persulcatus]|uniref:Uncharacterized protein n=1 Tax=Ixodes persulcatus TaxID=34615 RepID=A0AC60NU10_IXOPE|nr:hypothetical protein HPB47_012239 [Ixodes persulcatus]